MCAVVLHVSGYVALYGVCEDEEAEGGGYCVGRFRDCCGGLYDGTNYHRMSPFVVVVLNEVLIRLCR